MKISRFVGTLALVFAALPAFAALAADPLSAGFAQPPPDARPRTFWHWMNGNVTRDGITRDLEAMQRVGVGGVMIFDGSTYLPAGPAGYLNPHWRSLMTHAIQEGDRLGLDIGMHNAPGWSSSGGPWVQPAQAMQQLVCTETTVTGGRTVDLALPPPQTNLGFYRDALVIAFPALPAETTRYEDAIARITLGGRAVPVAALSDGRLDTSVRLTPQEPLLIEFKADTDLHALTAQPAGKGGFPALQVEASADGRSFTRLTGVAGPGRHGILAPAVRNFAATRARFVRVTSAGANELAELVLHRTPRISDWVAKANFDYRVSGQLNLPEVGRTVPGEPSSASGSAGTPRPTISAIDPRTVVDLTARVQAGRLVWDAPLGAWTILRLGHTPTGKENVAASAAGRGLEIDKFAAAATDFHFDHVIRQVVAAAAAAGTKGPATLIIDSYEAGMQNWTADFPAEFRRRAGYELWPYAPALFGRIVGDAGVAERFLFDFRRVQADLMAENYYDRMQQRAHGQGMKFYVEGYGSGNFDELRVAGLPDVPTTEFWTRTPWTPNRSVKMVTSAGHVYGKPVVAAESFTGEAQTSRWLEYPYALKALGDEMFAHGLNQLVFHTYAHQPHPDAAPGLTLGPYGFAFARTNTWFAQAGAWIDYLEKTQFLLQQGTYAADVLYFTGERSPDPSSMALPVLPAGYNYDLVNTDVLLRRVSVRDGDYVLPEGGRYRLLVLPPELKAMRPELMRKLAEFVAAGGAILGPQPVFSPTLEGYPASEAEMRRLAAALWAPGRTGPGRVIATGSIGDALGALGVAPDFTFAAADADVALSWAHRRLPEGDLYFLGNRQRRPRELLASFRGMAGRQPEIWRPESGVQLTAPFFRVEQDRLLMPLQFDPAESVFVLFRRPAATAAAALERDGRPVINTATPAPARTGPAPAGSFTMALWVKPDTDLRVMPRESVTGRIDEVGKFYAIPADPGDRRFGTGHVTAGLAVGRNGLFVVERAWDTCPAVLVADTKVSGWTHVAVVYREGRPRLYVNGAFVREGLVSGRTVHSGVGSPPPPVDYLLNFP
ncbi:MAG: glycosyl hydrolase, partial [Lacunisphaera sp.]|nr:glycosyl hydrolase [Lacunisphaera sp.]